MADPNEFNGVDPYKGAILEVLGDTAHPDSLRRRQIATNRFQGLLQNDGRRRRAAPNLKFSHQILSQWVAGQNDPLNLCVRWEAQLRSLVARPISAPNEAVIDEHIEAILGLHDHACRMVRSEGGLALLTQRLLESSVPAASPVPPLGAPAAGGSELGKHAFVGFVAALTSNAARPPEAALVDGTVGQSTDQQEARALAGRAEHPPSRSHLPIDSSNPETSIPRRQRSACAQGLGHVDRIPGVKLGVPRGPLEPGSARLSRRQDQDDEAKLPAIMKEQTDIYKGRIALPFLSAVSQMRQIDQLRPRPAELAMAQQQSQQAAPVQQNALPINNPPVLAPPSLSPLALMPARKGAGLAPNSPQDGILPNLSSPVPNTSSTIPRGQIPDNSAAAGSGIVLPVLSPMLPPTISLPAGCSAARTLAPSPSAISPFARFSGPDGHEKLQAQCEAQTRPRDQAKPRAQKNSGASARVPTNPARGASPALRTRRQADPNRQLGYGVASAWVPCQSINPFDIPQPQAPNFVPVQPNPFFPLPFQGLPDPAVLHDPLAGPNPANRPTRPSLPVTTGQFTATKAQDPSLSTDPIPRQRSRKQKFASRAPIGESAWPSGGGRREKAEWTEKKRARRSPGVVGWDDTLNITRKPTGGRDHGGNDGAGAGGEAGREEGLVLGKSTKGRKIKASLKLVGRE